MEFNKPYHLTESLYMFGKRGLFVSNYLNILDMIENKYHSLDFEL